MWLWWITEINSRYRRHLLDFEHFRVMKRNETKQREQSQLEKGKCNEMERWKRIRHERVWFDDNKSGKYKYAIFINECALQCQCTHNVYVWFIILSCGFLYRQKNFCHLCTQGTNTHRCERKPADGKRGRQRVKVRTNGFWFSIENDNTFSFFERAKVTINDINIHARTHTQAKIKQREWKITKINYTKYITHGPVICIKFGYARFPKRIQTR